MERDLLSIILAGIHGCVQPNPWMNERCMRVWCKIVFQPYISGRTEPSGLLLDDFITHKDGVPRYTVCYGCITHPYYNRVMSVLTNH